MTKSSTHYPFLLTLATLLLLQVGLFANGTLATASEVNRTELTEKTNYFAPSEAADCGGITATGLTGKIRVTVSNRDVRYVKVQKYTPYQEWSLCNSFGKTQPCTLNGTYEQALAAGSYVVEVQYANAATCLVTEVVVTTDDGGGNDNAPSEVAACPDNSPDVSAGVLGDPTAIAIPPGQASVYAGREVPTLREMFGVNVKVGDNRYFSNMENITGIFSHARVFYHMNKDYWIANPFTDADKDGKDDVPIDPNFRRPYQDRGTLRLIVDQNNVPVVTSTASDAKAVSYDPATRQLVTAPVDSYLNPYKNYINTNYFFIKDVYEEFEEKVQVSLVVVPGSFPAPQRDSDAYKFPRNFWTKEDWGESPANVQEAARAYALMFARTYAPTAADCAECTAYVDVLEISNEAWGYEDQELYDNIVEGFIAGIEEYYAYDATNKIKLIPGAFQANHLQNDDEPNASDYLSWKDYQGANIPLDKKCYLDGTNYHPYSNDLTDNDGDLRRRLVAHPEKASSKFLFIKNGWQWNEFNMPDGHNNIYVTEYGWDSEMPAACTRSSDNNPTGVGEVAQGVYLTRSTLMLARFGTYRAQPYELLDEDETPEVAASLCFGYHSSGVWNRQPNGAVSEKATTKILRKFVSVLGDKKFKYAVAEEAEGAYAYVLEDASGTPTYLVAWSATNINNQDFTQVKNATLPSVSLDVIVDGQPYQPNTAEAWYYLDDQPSGTVPVAQVYDAATQTYTLRPVPVVIPIVPGDGSRCTSYNSACSAGQVTVRGCADKIEVTATTAIRYVKVQRFNPYQEWWLCDPYGNASSNCAVNGVYSQALAAGTYAVEVQFADQSFCNTTDVVVGGGSTARSATSQKEKLIGQHQDIHIFPNPSSDYLSIQSADLTGRSVVVNVTDALGKLVQQATYRRVAHASVSLDLSELPSGIYLVRVQVDTQLQINQRIVIE